MPTGIPLRRTIVALLLAVTFFTATACGKSTDSMSTGSSDPSASPTSTVEKQKLAKTRFVANAGLAAGATYQWIVKPYKAGKFKKGASGRTFALVKAGLAGTFAYNRLKAAAGNAKADPTLSKAVAPLTAGIDALKDLPAKLRKGDSADQAANSFDDVINKVKEAGKSAGADVTDNVPSLKDIGG
ncbi:MULTISPECIES: hypothetical protein [unclassified Streptomyces]|uniref:hypothetical protein n=1 Tax=unclassified Streptomyces TaxID=2593676 RepID=UPI0036E4EBF0